MSVKWFKTVKWSKKTLEIEGIVFLRSEDKNAAQTQAFGNLSEEFSCTIVEIPYFEVKKIALTELVQ